MTSSEFSEAMYALHQEYVNVRPLSDNWWWVADRLPLDRVITALNYLVETPIMANNGNCWFQLCAILNLHKKCELSTKQRRWCICQLALWWPDICCRLES